MGDADDVPDDEPMQVEDYSTPVNQGGKHIGIGAESNNNHIDVGGMGHSAGNDHGGDDAGDAGGDAGGD